MKYLSFSINTTKYAVPVNFISESIQYSHITRIPKMPNFVLGVMNLRGKIVPVMDTRLRMGLNSRRHERKELLDLLKKREEEHLHWLGTLENEVASGQDITVQRNHKKCNFGKWYEPFMEDLDRLEKSGYVDNALLNTLKAFEAPHKEIHALADKADELIKAGKKTEAVKLLEDARENELAKMVKLFRKLYDVIEDQEKRDIVVIIQHEDDLFGITVDTIDSTIEIESYSNAPVPTDLVRHVSVVGDQTIQILNLDAFTEIAKKAA